MDDKTFQAINTILIIAGTILTIVVNFRRFLADRKNQVFGEEKQRREFIDEDLKRSRQELDRAYKKIDDLEKELGRCEQEKQENLILIASLTAKLQTR
jgi:hypothetical protein